MALDAVWEEAGSQLDVATFQDAAGTNLIGSNVATLLMTIYEETDGGIVNSREDVDMRNGGAWDAGLTIGTGTITLVLTAGDNTVTNAKNVSRGENHVIILEGTTSGSPATAFASEYHYHVKNRLKTT